MWILPKASSKWKKAIRKKTKGFIVRCASLLISMFSNCPFVQKNVGSRYPTDVKKRGITEINICLFSTMEKMHNNHDALYTGWICLSVRIQFHSCKRWRVLLNFSRSFLYTFQLMHNWRRKSGAWSLPDWKNWEQDPNIIYVSELHFLLFKR